MISVERFQEAFRDIGAACIPLGACSWETGHVSGREYAKLETDAADVDKDGDALFAGVISCLG